jgi:hypothetical protein
MQERLQLTRELLNEARDYLCPLPKGASHVSVPAGLLTGSLDGFEEFLAHNELELAWDALAEVAERAGASSVCWRKLAEAASLMELPDKEATAAQHANQG